MCVWVSYYIVIGNGNLKYVVKILNCKVQVGGQVYITTKILLLIK